MLSFRRFVSVFEEHHPEFPYKDIYSFQGIHCILYTNYQPHADFAFAYFRYYYDCCRDHKDILKLNDDNCYHVYSYVDKQSYLRLFEWIEEILLLRVGYFYDDIAEITVADGGIIVDKKKKMILCFNQTLRKIYFVSDGSQQLAQKDVVKTIREMITWEMEKRGYFLFHAAAVEKDGKSILFSGESGVGKTTIMLGLLEKGYHFLSNDRVLIGVEGRKVKTIAWPNEIGITLATTMQFEALIGIYADLGSLDFPQNRIHSLALDKLEENEIDRVDLSTEELVSNFESKFVRDAELEQIFLIDDFPTSDQFQKVAFSAVLVDQLKKNFFSPSDHHDDPGFLPWFQSVKKCSSQVLNTYELTLKIIAKLATTRKLRKERFPTIEEKIEQIARQI